MILEHHEFNIMREFIKCRFVIALTLLLPTIARGQAPMPNVEAVDDIFVISHDAVALKQALAQTAPNLLTNDENLPDTDVTVRITSPPARGEVSRLNERIGSFVYTPNYNGAMPGMRPWTGTDYFEYTLSVAGKAESKARVTIGTRYDGYTYFLDPDGDPADRVTPSAGGFFLAGGSDWRRKSDGTNRPWLEGAFTWLIQHANGNATWDDTKTPAENDQRGGDVLVMRASPLLGNDAAFLIRDVAARNHLPLNSIETIVFDPADVRTARQAANGHVGTLLKSLREAEAIYFGGGDQFIYHTVWGGTATLQVLNQRIQSGKAVLGGTSAGMHVMSGLSYVNNPNPLAPPNVAEGLAGVTSFQAIRDPGRPDINVRPGFVEEGWLKDQHVLTDTHFGQRQTGSELPVNLRGRMGRLVTMLARQKAKDPQATFHGLGADEATAVLVEADSGEGTVVGQGAAYLLTTPEQAPARLDRTAANGGKPRSLLFAPLSVIKLPGRPTFEPNALRFDFMKWRPIVGGVAYKIGADEAVPGEGGMSNLTDATRDVYDNPKR